MNKSSMSARDKTQYFDNLVYSEFSYASGAVRFSKQERHLSKVDSVNPGPADYNPEASRTISPSTRIGTEKKGLVFELEKRKTPGPSTYHPRFHVTNNKR